MKLVASSSVLVALSSNQKLGLALVAAVLVGFALLSAVVIPRSNPDFPEQRLRLFIGVSVALTAAMLLTVAFVARETGEEEASEPTPTTEAAPPVTTESTQEVAGDPVAGKAVFLAQPCGSCHALDDAGTPGGSGPDLDDSSPSYDKVVDRVTNGKNGMPSFEGSLSQTQIQDVAAYVSSVAGS